MFKKFLSLACITLFVFLAPPLIANAGPSIEQIMQNVEKIWKPVKDSQPYVKVDELKKIMDSGEKIVLVDVRTAKEYDAAHLPGAINITRGLVEWQAPKMIKNSDARIFVYCRTGARSSMVTKRLLEMGYTDVTNVYSSFVGWVKAGYSVYNIHGEFMLAPDGYRKAEPN